MKPRLSILCTLALSFFFLTANRSAADDQGWRLKLNAVALQPTAGGGFDPALGGGLALTYRTSRRLGVELSVMTAEVESELEVEFFTSRFTVVSRIETTPLLARLNWHLTPDKKADVYVGPVAGWVRYGDIETRIEGVSEAIDVVPVSRLETDDGFAWGAHVGVDVPVGDGRWFVTSGLTYLQADVDSGGDDKTRFELDPLVVRLGLGFRF